MFAHRPARGKSVAVAVVAALILHLMAFGAMVGGAVMDILTEEQMDESVSQAPLRKENDVLIELDALKLLSMRGALGREPVPPQDPDPVAIPPSELVQEDSKRFAETSPEQESEIAPEGAVLIGERDTLAASELAAAHVEGPEIPTQIGKEPERNEKNLTDSDFSPDQNEGQPVSSEEAKEISEPAGGASGDLSVTPEAFADSGERDVVEVPVDETNRTNEQDNQDDQQSARITNADGIVEEGLKERNQEKAENGGEQEGFRTESRKTRMEGTISRRGQSSLKVDATALGKYKALVNRIIETEWQRRCVMHRDHVLPGILTLRFYVDRNGRVSGLRYLDVFQASAIQKGFTMRAVQQPDLPRMPEEVAKELDGEPLEFHINFHF